MNRPALTASAFDRMAGIPPSKTPIIWTADAIAHRIGRSADYVRSTLVNQPGSPVKKIGRRYCAHEGDLIAFFRAGA